MEPDKKEKSKIDQLRRSEDFEEILGMVPSWPVRTGSSVVAIVLLVLLATAYFVKYPDIIQADITFSKSNPPIYTIAKESGKIQNIYVLDSQLVYKGDYLIEIENIAQAQHVKQLKEHLNSLREGLLSNPPNLNYTFETRLDLGEIQLSYLNFMKAYDDLKFQIVNQPFKKEIESIKKQVVNLQKTIRIQTNKKKLLNSELVLVQNDFVRKTKLFENAVIAINELEITEEQLISKKRVLEEIEEEILSNQTRIIQSSSEINKLSVEKRRVMDNLRFELYEGYKSLYNSILDWENRYIIMAPTDGRVTILKYWSKNQNVKIGDKVLAVIPEDKTDIVGKIELPIANSGKVEIGCKAYIKLDNYPHEEYGMLAGRIEHISQTSLNNAYILSVKIDSLVSTYNKQVAYKHGMSGTAEIITEDINLLRRLFYSLYKKLN